MTRARDTLILTGGIAEKKWETLWTKAAAITPQKIAGAKSFADWIGLWFADQVRSQESGVQREANGELPHLRWRLVADEELAEEAESRKHTAESELPALGEATKRKLREMLTWQYQFSPATKYKAKSSVTALRREAEESDDHAEKLFPAKWPATTQKRKVKSQRRKLSASEIGEAHHKFLQHVALEKTGGCAALKAEAERLEREKILSAEERAALDLEAVADFWNSEAGGRIREHAAFVKRELPFTAKFSPAELAGILGKAPEAGLENEFVVVQGVADLAVLLPKEIWLVDFKTDAVRADELPEKIRFYETQLKLYASALAKIYSRPVSSGWLHFLSARRTVEL
jgi:ATP-dependent helicase/nuclease subunit A